MNSRVFFVTTCFVLIGIARFALDAPTTFAQSPTEEPTKKPYIFPTPIFIPTYPNDMLQPPPARPTPGAPTTTEQPPSEQTYTVQPGDSLWIIAQKVYGSGAKYPLIASANDITTTTRLRTGIILKIPSAPGAATLTPTRAPSTPTLAATLALTASPTSALPTPTPSPTASSWIPASVAGPASTAINILSAILALASLASAVLAYVAYARARRLDRIAEGKPPIRLR